MLFQSVLDCGRSTEVVLSDLPVSCHTVLSSENPCSIVTSGSGPAPTHGTVTSTEKGSPSKPGTIPRHLVYRTGGVSLLSWSVGTSEAPATPAYGTTAWSQTSAARAGGPLDGSTAAPSTARSTNS